MRVKIFSVAFLLLMLNTVALLADEPGAPCDLTDPDNMCPLDTWVIVLAVIAAAFAAFHLYRKQKLSLAGNKQAN